MKVRIILITGGHVDFDAPEDFNLMQWVVSVRETGRWLVDTCYVPHESIVMALLVNEEGKQQTVKFEGNLQ